MATANLSNFLRRLTRGMAAETLGDESDRQLVERALAVREEAAFQAIVQRHGPMVYRVSWRVLQHSHDAEDAFQATFLILAQKLHTLRKHASLASWLHGVARRVALKAKAQAGARRRRENQAAFPDTLMPDDVTWRELRSALDGELSRLPDRWRLPLILCYLEGQTQDESAGQLGWSKSTLRRRLEEARNALAGRLKERGIVWSAALSAVLVSDCMARPAPMPGLVTATVEAATGVAGGKTVAMAASAKVAALTKGVLKAMLLSKFKNVAAVLLVFVVFGLGVSAFARLALAQDQSEDEKTQTALKGAQAPAPQKIQKKRAELDLTGRSDLVAIDVEKRTITGHELLGDSGIRLGLGKGSRLLWDCWTLSVGPATTIMIDGKKADLNRLQKIVQAVEPPHSIRAMGEWEFEVLKPRHSEQKGKAVRIEVWGLEVEGVVQNIDAGKRTISIDDEYKQRFTREVAKDVEVFVNGKAARFSDLKPNMHVFLQKSAVKNAPDVAVTALGPEVEGVLKAVNAEKKTISVSIPSVRVVAEGVPVATDATVVVEGKEGTLSDLKVGMLVTLRMCAETGQSLVVGISARKAAKER